MTKLVICDDELTIRNGLKRMIETSNKGIEIVGLAANGLEAYRLISETKPAVVLMDITMPGMKGLDVIRELLTEVPHTKFIIITGHDEFAYAQQAIKLGVYDYLLKPIDKTMLFPVIEKAANEYRKEMVYAESGPVTDQQNVSQKAIAFIRSHYRQSDLSLAQIATELHVSESYLTRIIKKETGKSYSDFLTELRIEEAKALFLSDRSLLSQEVAEMVGYRNKHYFCRIFKQYTGMSPMAYKQKVSGT